MSQAQEAPCLDESVVAGESWEPIHQLLQVKVQELKHQVQPPVRMNHIVQPVAVRR